MLHSRLELPPHPPPPRLWWHFFLISISIHYRVVIYSECKHVICSLWLQMGFLCCSCFSVRGERTQCLWNKHIPAVSQSDLTETTFTHWAAANHSSVKINWQFVDGWQIYCGSESKPLMANICALISESVYDRNKCVFPVGVCDCRQMCSKCDGARLQQHEVQCYLRKCDLLPHNQIQKECEKNFRFKSVKHRDEI